MNVLINSLIVAAAYAATEIDHFNNKLHLQWSLPI